MSFIAGAVGHANRLNRTETAQRLVGICQTHGRDCDDPRLASGASPAELWQGNGACLAHVLHRNTHEDELDSHPIVTADGSVLLFDGRLDNRDDLARHLGLSPTALGQLGDGGLTAQAILRWGDDAAHRLIGDFCYVRWQPDRQRLTAVADGCGGRTLYFHLSDQMLVFASRPHAVLAFPHVPRTIDRQLIGHLLLMRPIPNGRSAYAQVGRLQPGQMLTWTPGNHGFRYFWRLGERETPHFRRDADYVEAARHLLDQAVQSCLRGTDGMVACMTSGGLDSPAVATTAARQMPHGIVHAITVTPSQNAPLPNPRPDECFDEWDAARSLGQMYPNIRPHRAPAPSLTMDEQDPRRLFQTWGIPIRNVLNVGCFSTAFATARSLGCRTILFGTAGNMTLTWSAEAVLADLFLSGQWIELFRQARGLTRQKNAIWQPLKEHLLRPLIPQPWRQWRYARMTQTPWRDVSAIRDGFAHDMKATDLYASRSFRHDRARGRDRARHIFHLEGYLATRQLERGWPYMYGCDTRDPLADRRLVDFCLGLPPGLWQRDGVLRHFARSVLADRVPEQILTTPRHGVQCAEWHSRLQALRPTMRAELDALRRSPQVNDMLDLDRLQSLLEAMPDDVNAAEREKGLYLAALGRGVHYARFIQWVDGGN